MIAQAGSSAAERFRDIIGQRLGLHFEDAKLGFLDEVLRRRQAAGPWRGDTYLEALAGQPAADELAALAQELTVGETYFFRHSEQLRVFVEVGLPERLRARAGDRRLRLLSAGCASGEEAYSLAILLRERLPDPTWDASILGVDLNPAAIEKAERARFSAWSLRETPAEVQQRWFRMDGREAVPDDAVRGMARFAVRNLVAEDPGLWPAEGYDAVFCRNVIMYLRPEQAQRVIRRIAGALVPGGLLFLGHAETLRGLSDDFHLCQTHGTFYYRRKPRLDAPPDPPLEAMPASASAPRPLPEPGGGEGWIEAIRRASERIQVLTAGSGPGPRSTAVPGAADAGVDLGQAIDLLRSERFAEALDLVAGLPPASARDPAVLLLRAVLLAHSGQPVAAEQACQALLAIDELHAGAHYVLALCREGAGDLRGARDHDGMAAYLDRTFAMPRLHLGLLACKQGDRETARRELGQALVLLQHEDPLRLLLFGGGFSRDALMALCRAELAIGGGP